MKTILTSTRSVATNKTKQQLFHDVLFITITALAVLLEVADAASNFNHRRLDDSGPSSMDAESPGLEKQASSRATALVEEVFGPAAVVEADESRRIYAISIPGIYSDPGHSTGYQPPVYRPKSSRHDEEIYPPFEGAQSPSAPQVFPQNYWKSGLRLIVSGPADETELPITSPAAQPSFKYSHDRQQSDRPVPRFINRRRPSLRGEEFPARDFDDFTRHLDRRGNTPPRRGSVVDEDYSSAISRPNHAGIEERPLDDYDSRSLSNYEYNAGADRPFANLRLEEERALFGGDLLDGSRHYDDGRDYFGGSSLADVRDEPRGKLPSGFVLHGEPALNKQPLLHSDRDHPQNENNPPRHGETSRDEPAYSTFEDDYEVPLSDKSINADAQNRDEKPIIFNRPYPKLATPHNVAGIRGGKKTSAARLPDRQNDEAVTPIGVSVENEEKEDTIPSSLDSSALDYYDDLYEEFMQSAYNDYFDDPHSENPKKESDKSSSPQHAASDEKLPVTILSAPDGRHVEQATTQVSLTRRDPPSDMYTTSRTIGLPATSTTDEIIGGQSTEKSTAKTDKNPPERTSASSTLASPSSPLSVASVELPEASTSGSDVPVSSEAPKASTSTTDYATTSGISEAEAPKSKVSSETPFTTTQSPSTFAVQHPYKSSAPTSTKISLSEVLQSIGLSLPQFLVQLKMHKMDLKQFTNKLEKRSLTEKELKRAEGNLGMLLKILDETSTSTEQPTTAYSPHTSERPSFKKISHDPQPKVTTEQNPTLPSVSTAIPNRVTTNEEPSPLSENSTSVISTTTLPPKRFGFRPSTDIQSHGQVVISPNITSVNSTESETVSFPEEVQRGEGNSELDGSAGNSKVSLRPYRPTFGDWKERMNQNRGVSSRLGTTTRRPKFRPAYTYYGGETDLQELIDKQNEENQKGNVGSTDEESSAASKESSIFLSKGESTVVGLTEGTPLGGSYDHPRYDRDPNSLNIATRSAIMAAGVLGGVALAVFITIFVFVMYRNHVGRRRLRVPFPVSISSDESVSSTPELYSTRSRLGLGGRTSSSRTDFWGTLKRKFDPYSLNSSTASYY